MLNSTMEICKMDTDSETILAECETIQKQFGDHSLIREGLDLETAMVEAIK